MRIKTYSTIDSNYLQDQTIIQNEYQKRRFNYYSLMDSICSPKEWQVSLELKTKLQTLEKRLLTDLGVKRQNFVTRKTNTKRHKTQPEESNIGLQILNQQLKPLPLKIALKPFRKHLRIMTEATSPSQRRPKRNNRSVQQKVIDEASTQPHRSFDRSQLDERYRRQQLLSRLQYSRQSKGKRSAQPQPSLSQTIKLPQSKIMNISRIPLVSKFCSPKDLEPWGQSPGELD